MKAFRLRAMAAAALAGCAAWFVTGATMEDVHDDTPVYSIDDPFGLGLGLTVNGVFYRYTNSPVITVTGGVTSQQLAEAVAPLATTQQVAAATAGMVTAVATNGTYWLFLKAN